ncbi:MAG: hypothetical protein J6C41_06040 [Oscillospiraceae bacterium]|nr:hypothetical protein [Oscillospiraceae bacterium]
MKKTFAWILALVLCLSLCACGGKKTTQAESPDDWDRIAEATATLNKYYACQTEEEFREVLHSGISDSTLKMIMDNWRNFRESWNMDNVGISEQYVRKIKYIETYKGNDLFIVSNGYVMKDGSRTPDEPLPEIKGPLQISPVMQQGSFILLTIENGRYVIANADQNELQSYVRKFVPCSCDLGTVVVPGDPCKGCNGEGYLTEQPDADAENEDGGVCETCGGYGWIEKTDTVEDVTDPNQLSLELAIVPCPDCALEFSGIGIVGGMAVSNPCPDCQGTGLENYTHGECPDCGGIGYTTNE